MPQSEAAYRKLSPVLSLIFTGLSLIIVLCGCPYHSSHRIDSEPQIQVDETYLGNWDGFIKDETYGKETDFKMSLSRKNDYEYTINFMGYFGAVDKKNKPKIDTIKGSAFMSDVCGKQFLNVNIFCRIYIAEFIYKNDEITLLPLAEGFTSFIVRSDEELRFRIAYHYKTRLMASYDESFCMKKMKREPSIP